MSEGCSGGRPRIAGFEELGELHRRYVAGFASVGARRIPVVATRLSAGDVLGGWMVRWNMGRSRYRVLPGLYAAGRPGPESPVLVTANYKLSFDRLRRELTRVDAWILVLDTRGVNVWCAAGKGTFGTRELLDKIAATRLEEISPRPRLILPQLGAPGVSAHEVRAATGFAISFGPVRAADLPAYLSAGLRKTDAMRTVGFNLADRMALAPVELMQSLPIALLMLVVSALAALPPGPLYLSRAAGTFLPLVGSLLVGTLVFPALLPWIPFRAFSLKGAVLGAAWGVAASLVFGRGVLAGAAITLCVAPLISFIAMNFTGASTYTCLSGAELEVKRGVLPMAASLVAGIGLLVAGRFLGA